MLSSGFIHWRANCSFGPGGSSGRGRQPRSLANRRREEERRWQERPRRRRSGCAGTGTGTGDGRPPPAFRLLAGGAGSEENRTRRLKRGLTKHTQGSGLDQSATLARRQKLEEMRGARRRACGSPIQCPSALPGLAQGIWISLLGLPTLGFSQLLPALFRGSS